jgi:cobalamin biosynthesis protein CobT
MEEEDSARGVVRLARGGSEAAEADSEAGDSDVAEDSEAGDSEAGGSEAGDSEVAEVFARHPLWF